MHRQIDAGSERDASSATMPSTDFAKQYEVVQVNARILNSSYIQGDCIRSFGKSSLWNLLNYCT